MNILEEEINWFTEALQTRLKLYFNQETKYKSVFSIPAPPHIHAHFPYSRFVMENKLSPEDRILLMLALAPMLKPQLLDNLFLKNSDTDQRFTEFGCIKGQQHGGLIPTLETFLFLVAGDNLEERIKYLFHISGGHELFRRKLLQLENQHPHEPFQSSALIPSPELTELLIQGKEFAPDFSTTFPAQKVTTEQTWDDLVLEADVIRQLEEIKSWVEHGD